MYRGRLIWPMSIEFELLDTSATRAADPLGLGAGTGYDDDFQEPVVVPPSEGAPGVPATGAPRGELTTVYSERITLPGQVEVEDWNALRAFANGNTPRAEIRIVHHFFDIENRGMLDDTGRATIRNGARLRRILHPITGNLIVEIPTPPGLYAVQVDDMSFGLSGLTRNLLVITYQDREEGES